MKYKTTKKINKKVINEILQIKQKKGLTPEAIVENAKKKTSPLHKLFEWKDTTAAYQWRLQQARVLINEVKIIIEDKEYYAFENISIEVGENKTREYYEREEILSSDQLRKKVIQTAYEQLLYWKNKYENYSVFTPIFNGIAEVEKAMQKKQKKIKAVA